MKFFDEKRHLPPGWDWDNTKALLAWLHSLSPLTLLIFTGRYFDARSALYEIIQNANGTVTRHLVEGRQMLPFWELMTGSPLWGLWIFLALMIAQGLRHRRFFTQGSMSIYTMRRLPDKWELHRRCWTVPVLSAVAELLIFAVGIILCWLLWRFATPTGHLPM